MEENKDSAFSIRGEVEITDLNTGKVLVHNHNMIVDGGLNFIRSAILHKFTYDKLTTAYSDSKYDDGKITFEVKFGTGADDTVKTTSSLISTSNEKTLNVNIDNKDIEYETTNNRIKITLNVSNTSMNSQIAVSELGLFIVNGGSGTLFSRITFDPIFYTASTPFKLSYYIYL